MNSVSNHEIRHNEASVLFRARRVHRRAPIDVIGNVQL